MSSDPARRFSMHTDTVLPLPRTSASHLVFTKECRLSKQHRSESSQYYNPSQKLLRHQLLRPRNVRRLHQNANVQTTDLGPAGVARRMPPRSLLLTRTPSGMTSKPRSTRTLAASATYARALPRAASMSNTCDPSAIFPNSHSIGAISSPLIAVAMSTARLGRFATAQRNREEPRRSRATSRGKREEQRRNRATPQCNREEPRRTCANHRFSGSTTDRKVDPPAPRSE